MNVQLIEIDSPAFHAIIEDTIRKSIEIGIEIGKKQSPSKDDREWVELSGALEILKGVIGSRHTLKEYTVTNGNFMQGFVRIQNKKRRFIYNVSDLYELRKNKYHGKR